MKRRDLLAGAGASLLAPEAFAQAPPPDDAPWIPFTSVDGHIRLPVTINGVETLAVLDSGAGGIALDRAAAARFGVEITSRVVHNYGISRGVDTNVSGPFVLRFAHVTLNVQEAVLADFSALALAGLGDFSILVGRDIYEQFLVDMHFANDRLALRSQFTPPPEAATVSLRPAPLGQRVLDMQIGNLPLAQAVFDLGSASALAVSTIYAETHGLLRGLRTSTWIRAGIEGIVPYRVATLARLRVGPATFTDVPVDVHDDWASTDIAGNLGNPVLRRMGRLVTHYARDLLFVLPDGRAHGPFAKNRSGLALSRFDDRLRVMHVAPGSPGEAAGWRVDDEILALNDSPIDATYNRRWGEAPAGTIVSLTRANGARSDLILADYF